jgi:hypothetical protein
MFAHRASLVLSLSLFLFWPAFLHAQNDSGTEPVISTDRPTVADFSPVVPRNYLQAENGFLVTKSEGQHILDLPETELRYGLLDKTELRLFVPDFFQSLGSGPASISGFGDLSIGVKHNLGGDFNFLVNLFVSLPTGARAISSHGYDPGIQLPWSRQVSKNWSVAGQAAFYWPTQAGSHNFTGEFTFLVDRQLARPWDVFIEYAGDFPDKGDSRQLLHFGSAYKLSARQQIDFQVAGGLSRAAPNYFIGVGYSFLLRVVK